MDRKMHKIIVVGEGGVGKTSFIRRHTTGEFKPQYVATNGMETTPYPEKEIYPFVFWDCAGQKQFEGLREGYYIGADAAILMFDVTFTSTYKNLEKRYRDIRRVCGNIPIVLVGNKTDMKQQCKIWSHAVDFHGLQYYPISSKSNSNFELPLKYLLKKLNP